MNSTETGEAIDYLEAAFPGETLAAVSRTLWIQALQTTDVRDAVEATFRLARSRDRMPTLHQFLAEVRNARQARLAVPSYEPGSEPWPHKKSDDSRLLAAIHTYWDEAQRDRPKHDHRNGLESCPKCTTSEAFLAEHTPIIQKIVQDQIDEWRAAGRRP